MEDAEDFIECAHAFRKHVSMQLAIIRGEKPEAELAVVAAPPKATAMVKKVALVVAREAARDRLSLEQTGPKGRGRPLKAETVLLKARINAAVAAVLDCRDGRRKRASMFLELPEREINPEYYAMITSPIDLNTIQAKVADGRYNRWAAFETDMMTLFANAKLFNDPRSVIFNDAEVMQRLFEQLPEVPLQLPEAYQSSRNSGAGSEPDSDSDPDQDSEASSDDPFEHLVRSQAKRKRTKQKRGCKPKQRQKKKRKVSRGNHTARSKSARRRKVLHDAVDCEPSEASEDDSDEETVAALKQKLDGTAEVVAQLKVGQEVKVSDQGVHAAQVLALDEEAMRVKVHFSGWNSRFDNWYPANSAIIKVPKPGESSAANTGRGGRGRGRGRGRSRPALTPPAAIGGSANGEPENLQGDQRTKRARVQPDRLVPSMSKASLAQAKERPAVQEEDTAAGFSEVAVHKLSVGLDALRPRVLKMSGMWLSLHVAGGTDADKPALMAFKDVVNDQLPHLRAGSHLHYLIFSKHTSTLLLTEGEGKDAVVAGGGTFRMLRSKEGTMAIEVLVLAVSASAQGQGHGTRIVNGMKALALAEADRSMPAKNLSTRGRGACGCLMVTQADAGASTVRFWRRQRLETGPEADRVVMQSQRCGKHGGTFVVYENTVNMLVALDLESVYVRPKWKKWSSSTSAADGAATVMSSTPSLIAEAETHEDLSTTRPIAAAPEVSRVFSSVDPRNCLSDMDSPADFVREHALGPVGSGAKEQPRSPCTTTAMQEQVDAKVEVVNNLPEPRAESGSPPLVPGSAATCPPEGHMAATASPAPAAPVPASTSSEIAPPAAAALAPVASAPASASPEIAPPAAAASAPASASPEPAPPAAPALEPAASAPALAAATAPTTTTSRVAISTRAEAAGAEKEDRRVETEGENGEAIGHTATRDNADDGVAPSTTDNPEAVHPGPVVVHQPAQFGASETVELLTSSTTDDTNVVHPGSGAVRQASEVGASETVQLPTSTTDDTEPVHPPVVVHQPAAELGVINTVGAPIDTLEDAHQEEPRGALTEKNTEDPIELHTVTEKLLLLQQPHGDRGNGMSDAGGLHET